jgi:hypothetical protein
LYQPTFCTSAIEGTATVPSRFTPVAMIVVATPMAGMRNSQGAGRW